MFKSVKSFFGVFGSYTFADKVVSAGAVIVFLLMIIKLYVFPYGLFGFGADEIYTEGLVSRNGIQNLNPLFVDYNEADREVSRLIFSGLMKYNPDTEAVVEDMGKLTINEERTEFLFDIREGIKWHDGEPFTAEDVYFTFHDVVLDPAFQNQVLRTNFASVNIELVDDMTIKFTLEKPNIFFLSNLTTGVLPEHILGDMVPDEILESSFNKQPIGTGPYMVTEPVELFPDQRTQITLSQNPYYYEPPSEVKFMRFVAYPTMEQLIEALNAVNGVVKVTGEYLEAFEGNERFELIPYELPQYLAVYMNMDSPVLSQAKKVRLALQKAIDKDALIGDSADKIRVDTPLMELNQEDWEYQPNKMEAQGALVDSGYTYADEDTDKLGIRYDSDGNALELKFIARAYDQDTVQFEETLAVAEALQIAWEDIGFSIQLEFLPLGEFNERIMSRQYDLLLVGQNLGYNLDNYSYWHSTQATPLGQNFSNYRSFAADSIIEGVREVVDKEQRREGLKDLAEKLKDDIPAIFLYRPVYFYATDGKVTGLSMDGVAFPSDRFERVSTFSFK